MVNTAKIIIAIIGLLIAFEAALISYFYRTTMIRKSVDQKQVIKMSGVDWEKYYPMMAERRSFMLNQSHEDVWTESQDGLRLHGTYFKGPEGPKIVICFHGYSSQGITDYTSISNYYLTHGFRMLLVDERAHGQSEGKYVGFGCMDRYDALQWITWTINKFGDSINIFLHGISMGGATVLMASGLDLPPQVKGIISDCAFTSAAEMFKYVLNTKYHIPSFPIIQISNIINKRFAGYGMSDCNSAIEVRKAKVPILLIHGENDEFVPLSMGEEIYENIASKKMKLIVKGAAHSESYYKETKAYEEALDSFINEILNK
ncbi:alpha/beta hydrolase [Histomonas meleagridis]|uniref:alpha/beta hydrolase n=1 Tax=Histomonas meleagridis TaxID=135588 RepID=UPI003559AD7F|nr:alpha/beta hydrolase [Histomonas meleagridis]KAH0804045.1 alpha/beta hydrolase [Histomonas meleagridis]